MLAWVRKLGALYLVAYDSYACRTHEKLFYIVCVISVLRAGTALAIQDHRIPNDDLLFWTYLLHLLIKMIQVSLEHTWNNFEDLRQQYIANSVAEQVDELHQKINTQLKIQLILRTKEITFIKERAALGLRIPQILAENEAFHTSWKVNPIITRVAWEHTCLDRHIWARKPGAVNSQELQDKIESSQTRPRLLLEQAKAVVEQYRQEGGAGRT